MASSSPLRQWDNGGEQKNLYCILSFQYGILLIVKEIGVTKI